MENEGLTGLEQHEGEFPHFWGNYPFNGSTVFSRFLKMADNSAAWVEMDRSFQQFGP